MSKKKKHPIKERAPKRYCVLRQAGIEKINYKDIEILKLFITEKGKIIPRRISGLSARSQTRITTAIKQARNVALLSFSLGYVPQEESHETPSTTQYKDSK
ncbi:MAG: 30S ribosomal protein S18 [Deltaproteobacteria bacterium]|nr:30S ribosomal protein S18 [Deltaproteobacteria bacterium]